MNRSREQNRSRRPSALVLGLGLALGAVLAAPAARAQDTGVPRGSAREAMWPAPTDDDWAKPCLITFQRTWGDALAVSKETGKAILICINMDGEIASEHYAGKRYRDPAIAALYEPYVCVIASVYRHSERDHDDQGRRILCPRFGSVTCGEHIAIEPILYEKFMDEQRIAPRHIMVELDGSETYDVFYANDTASVFQAISDGIANRTVTPKNIVRGDKPIVERVASRDIADREAVEAAYRDGDRDLRQALLDAARKHPEAAPMELLRLAVSGFDADLSQAARATLATTDSTDAVDLIAEALQVPMTPEERDALIAALERIGGSSRRAAWLAVVHKGLSGASSPIDSQAWTAALSDARAPRSYEHHALQQIRAGKARESRARPDDPLARVELALANLELARTAPGRATDANAKTADQFRRLMYHDARAAAVEAEKLGSQDWRIDAIVAAADYYTGKIEDAYPRAEAAMNAMPAGETSWTSMAVLTIYGESRFKAIKAAVRDKKKWAPEWLADLHAAYSVLLQHPLASDDQVLWYYDFLDWLRARGRAGRYLDAAVARFPESSKLHQRLRMRYLRWRGPRELEAKYAELTEDPGASPNMAWYAGYASVVAADSHRRGRRPDDAIAAYGRAIELFERSIAGDDANRASADHQIALVLAGRSRVHYQLGDDEHALADILASFARRADSAGTRDGVGITPGETGQMLLARLREQEKTEAVMQLEQSLAQLDQELLVPDRP